MSVLETKIKEKDELISGLEASIEEKDTELTENRAENKELLELCNKDEEEELDCHNYEH